MFFTLEIHGQTIECENVPAKAPHIKCFFSDVKQKIGQEKNQIEITDDEIRDKIDSLPAFGIYKDNYFITGIPLNTTINKTTADVKFQISIRHRLTNSELPFNTFLYFTYTQKSFWDIYLKSSPFRDNNYNPGIGLGRYAIKDSRLVGGAFLQVEHESNGISDSASRSVNYVSLIGKYFFNESVYFRIKASVPYLYRKENADILDYKGLGNFSIDYKSKNSKWWFSAGISPTKNFSRINTTLNGGYRISSKFNQYIFGEYYNGTGDSQLDYKRKYSQIRIGIGIKPDFYSIF